MATWRASEPADATDVPVGAGYIRENNTQIQAVCTAARLAAGTEIPDVFDDGGVVKCWFYLNAAPTNWTEVGSLGDTLLAVKGGTTYTTGGDTAGTWTQPDHTLTTDEMPSHTHTITASGVQVKSGTDSAYILRQTGATTTSSTGGGTAHSHGTTYRPASRVGILASFD